MFLAQKKRASGGHALIKHCSRVGGRFCGYGKGGKKYYRLQTNGEGGNGFKLWPLKIINTALFIKCCMVIVYKKVITAFLKFYILLTRSNTTNFQNHEIQILVWINRTTLVCLVFFLKSNLIGFEKNRENSEFVVSEFRWLDLVNKTWLYNNMEFF